MEVNLVDVEVHHLRPTASGNKAGLELMRGGLVGVGFSGNFTSAVPVLCPLGTHVITGWVGICLAIPTASKLLVSGASGGAGRRLRFGDPFRTGIARPGNSRPPLLRGRA